MEKNLIMLIGALFVITLGLLLVVGLYVREKKANQSPFVFSTARISTISSPVTANSIGEATDRTARSSESVTNATEAQVTESENTTTNSSQNRAHLFKNIVIIDESLDNRLDNEVSANLDVCNTTSCQTAGKLIKDAINASADPCNDFYEFACGGWLSSHTIPKEKSRFGNFDELDQKLKQSIRDELSRASEKTDANAVIYASDLYKACVDIDTVDARGVTPLLSALNSIGGWPLTGNNSFDENKYDWKESLAAQTALLGLTSIYSISVLPDANDTKINRIYFDASGFGLGRNQLVNRTAYPDIVNAYRKYITQSATLLGNKNDSKAQKDVEDLLDFESKLANLSLPQESKRDSKVWYNRMTFKQFIALTNNRVNWVTLTNSIYSKLGSSIRVTEDELVIVQDIEYYKAVTKLFESTPNRVIANYLGWMSVMSYGSFTTKLFRDVVFQFSHVVSGVEAPAEQWRLCVSQVSTALEYAVSRLYVDKNFSQKDKQEASLMIKDIQDSYNELIKESDWLDDITKNKSLIKLNAIKENIGYPDWLLSNTELDKYYNLTQKADPKKSFESILYLQFVSTLRDFKSIRESVNLTLSWPMPPAMVNAAYEPTQNSITIPAGILKLPFFDSQRPAYVNYGAIGVVVGHEMTHGFDDEGSQFDPNGNLINWWTEKIHKSFEEKAQCFINEYSKIYDTEAKMNLNGNNTVGENIADNGGLREAYRAYKSYVSKHGEPQRLPFVSEYTPEQIFFISYANTWCTLIRPEALKQQIQYNPHSPGMWRANVPVSNFKAFADVYNCKPESRMNPKDKCVLW